MVDGVVSGRSSVQRAVPVAQAPEQTASQFEGVRPCLTGAVARGVAQTDFEVECDRVGLMIPVMADSSVLEAFGVGEVPPERRGRNRGPIGTRERSGWLPGWGGKRFFVSWRHFDNGHQSELRVEFNPSTQTRAGCGWIGSVLQSLGVKVGRCWVERFDVSMTWSGPSVRRERLRLDPGGHTLDLYGVRSSGPETEMVGKGWGSGFQVVLYDKRAERIAKGAPDPGPCVRFEVRRRGKVDVVGESEPRLVRLSELHQVAWPCPPSITLREFAWLPDEYKDPRYGLLASAAWIYGTRAAERASAAVLSGLERADRREKLRFCVWPEVEPSPASVFERRWAGVVGRLIADLEGGPGVAV